MGIAPGLLQVIVAGDGWKEGGVECWWCCTGRLSQANGRGRRCRRGGAVTQKKVACGVMAPCERLPEAGCGKGIEACSVHWDGFWGYEQ